jgi:hypothetical protein
MEHEGSSLRQQKPATSLSWVRSIHIFTPYFFMINFNIIPPSTTRSYKYHLPSKFSYSNALISPLPNLWYMPCPSLPPWSDRSSNVWEKTGLQITKVPIVQVSTDLRLLPSTLSSYILNLHLPDGRQSLHSYKEISVSKVLFTFVYFKL